MKKLFPLCLITLALAVPQMEGDVRMYFDRLHKMAGLVLETIHDESQPDPD